MALSLTLLLLNLPMVLLFGLQVWEYARFHTSRTRELRRTAAEHAMNPGVPRALVVVPCRGTEPGLAGNLNAILRQDHAAYRVRCVVESESDPATATIRQVIADTASDATCTATTIELMIAGLPESPETGRKIHGLLAATRDLPDDCRAVAFFDSDVRPAPWALRALTSHTGHEEPPHPAAPRRRRRFRKPIGAATGYRWLIPGVPDEDSDREQDRNNTGGSGGRRVAGVNGAVAVLFGKDSPTFVWGGAWAMPRGLFDRLEIRRHWHGGLSDDMIVRRVLLDAGYRSQFDPGAVVVGHWNGSLTDGFRFIRRQYQFIRHTATAWWVFALGVLLIGRLAFWVPPAAMLGTWATGPAAAIDGIWWGVALLWGTLVLLRTIIEWKIGDFERRAFAESVFHDTAPGRSAQPRFARHGPLTGLYHLIAAVAAGFGSTILWRGIRYSTRRQPPHQP